MRIRRTLVVSCIVAIGLAAALGSATIAENPFLIDGVVTDESNSKAVGEGAKDTDAHGNTRELGPVQGSTTKFPVIHGATPNMLGLSNPNGQTDLHEIYTQSQKDASGNAWFYFGWSRDSNSGSGFISFEAHQTANDCASYSPEDLADCNPWSPRTAGDFVIFWDQSGSSTNIYLRVWDGSAFQPSQPGLLLNSLTDADGNPVVFAQYSADLFRGEMALNLTGAGLVGVNECKSFTNVIPGTITGNSQGDQADFKDVVLAPISIDTCGAITVTKVTKGPDGKIFADTTSSFGYTLKKGAVTIASTTIKGCTQSDPNDCNGPVHSYTELNPGTDYSIEETTPLPGKYLIESIACTNGSSFSTTTTGPLTFTLPESGAMACTITNKLPLGDSALATTPLARFILYDSVNVSLENKLPDNTIIANVTFELFSTSDCSGTPIATRTRSITFANGLTGSATTLPGGAGTETIPTGDFGIVVNNSGTYYWKVAYPGDTLNKPATVCGEATTVSKSFQP